MNAKTIGMLVALGALTSALFPSPTTVAKFKPWKDPDPSVRATFFVSIVIALIFLFILLRRNHAV